MAYVFSVKKAYFDPALKMRRFNFYFTLILEANPLVKSTRAKMFLGP